MGIPRRVKASPAKMARGVVQTAAAAVVLVLGGIELFSGGRVRSFFSGFGRARDISEEVTEIDRVVDGTLVKLGVSGTSSTDEERTEGRLTWVHREQSGRLPYGVSLFEVNLAVTRAVREAGGSVIRAGEGSEDWRGLKSLNMRIGVGDIETHGLVLSESPRPDGYRPVSAAEGAAPRIAIVIDDLGNNDSQVARGLLELDYPITFSVLPNCPHTEDMAAAARRAGKEVMVHVPMEPRGYPDTDPGEGALMTNGTREEIERALVAALDDVPHAVGANNHMGSSFTASRIPMRVVMRRLRDRGLYFLDSMTTPGSVGVSEAERAGVPTARNRMFLDSPLDEQGRVDVDAQLEELVEIARKNGSAVGIGHPYPETLDALRRALPELERQGVELVFVSELVR